MTGGRRGLARAIHETSELVEPGEETVRANPERAKKWGNTCGPEACKATLDVLIRRFKGDAAA